MPANPKQPYTNLANWMASRSGLIDQLGNADDGEPWLVFNQPPDSNDSFPRIVWSVPEHGHSQTVLVERWDKHEDRVRFNLYLPHGFSYFGDLSREIDELFNAWWREQLDHVLWKVQGMRRLGPWFDTIVPKLTTDRGPVQRVFSDWLFRYALKQDDFEPPTDTDRWVLDCNTGVRMLLDCDADDRLILDPQKVS
jgi:hypothetical protein